MAPQIGLLLVTLCVELICLAKKFPIYVLGTFPGVVDLMFREFCGKTVEWTFMDPTDKPFYHLLSKEFQILEEFSLLKFIL